MLDITRGTMNGPTRLALFSRSVSVDSKKFWVDEPPDPMTMPVRTLETWSSARLESATACTMAR